MSGQSAGKVTYREINNHKQARSGTATPKKPGPAKGNRGAVNPTHGGGINRPTKSSGM
jgi:hypothetical protein